MTEETKSGHSNNILDRFIEWFNDFATVNRYSDTTCEITLPFRDPRNDLISVLIKQAETGHIIISDMGAAFGYLHLNGIIPDKKDRHR